MPYTVSGKREEDISKAMGTKIINRPLRQPLQQDNPRVAAPQRMMSRKMPLKMKKNSSTGMM